MNSGPSPKTGFVYLITYGIPLNRDPATEDQIRQRAREIMRTDTIDLGVTSYYDAAREALDSGERLAIGKDKDNLTRDFLTRFLAELDQHRPWAPAPAHAEDPHRWASLRQAPVIGRLHLSRCGFLQRFHTSFCDVGPHDEPALVNVFTLYTGQTIALRGRRAFNKPGMDIHSFDDPVATSAQMESLLGLHVRAPLPAHERLDPQARQPGTPRRARAA